MGEKSALVPRLRFPEFRESGEWISEFGGVLFNQVSNKDHNSDLPVLAITQEHGAIPRNLIDYHVSVADKSIDGYKVVEVGDFIISLRSFQGGIEYSSYKGICSPAYVILRLAPEHSADYFRHFLKTDRFIGQLTKNLEGLRDGKMVSYKQFSELQLPTPPRKEQQKIADCLSSRDELITAEAQKLDALKTHKKGLMQQLFPREGEAVPRLRFPEFREAGEWKLDPLSTFVSALDAGVSVNAGDRPAMPAEIGVLKTSCVTNGVFELSQNKVVLEPEELERVTECVRKDTIIISRMNTLALVGASAYVESDDSNIFLPDRLWAAKPAPNANMRFIAYILGADRGRRALSELAAGSSGSMKNIAKPAVLELLISAPEPAEQKRIADCLSSLDDLITAQGQKIDALKTHKKGLMQQLFPVLDEAPG